MSDGQYINFGLGTYLEWHSKTHLERENQKWQRKARTE